MGPRRDVAGSFLRSVLVFGNARGHYGNIFPQKMHTIYGVFANEIR